MRSATDTVHFINRNGEVKSETHIYRDLCYYEDSSGQHHREM